MNEEIPAQSEKLIFDLIGRKVWQGKKEIELSPLEYQVLTYLARRAGQVVSYGELWEYVWQAPGSLAISKRHTVRAVIKRLPRKLGDRQEKGRYLVVARGVGVRLRRRSMQIQ